MDDDVREPPQRVRLTGLQEAQLHDLCEVERAGAAMYYEIGFDGAEVPLRSQLEIAKLTRDHDVIVVEADHVVAGYLAWRDESPGVAYLADLWIHPDFQRFGLGTRLVDQMFAAARGAGLKVAVVRCWERATWASSFYAKRGFVPIEGELPAALSAWLDERSAIGRPLTRPGEILLWTAVPPAPVDEVTADEA